MQERIDKELALLRRSYPDLEYRAEGRWIRVPAYPLPPGWSSQTTDVAFDIPPEFPGGPPYGIYVPAGLTVNGQRPDNYAEPASKQPPFEGTWGVLSWTTLDGQWRATAEPDPTRGYSLLSWVKGFAERLREGK